MKTLLVVHPSDEMYGADRVLLEVLGACPPGIRRVCWLPTDVDYPQHALCSALEDLGVEVVHRPLPVLRRAYMRPTCLPQMVWRFLTATQALLRLRPTAVYLNTTATLPLIVSARLARAELLTHVHEAWQNAERKVLGPALALSPRILVVSEATRRALPARLGRRAEVVYNGFPESGPVIAPPSDGPVRLLLASRWNTWKGHRELLAAWAHLRRRDVRLVVLGGPPASGETVDVPGIVSMLPNADSVEIVGEVSDVTSYIRSCHGVLVPSAQPDPLPTIALEAASHGRGVIASDVGGLPEIIDDGKTGRLLPAHDLGAWVKALEHVDRGMLARWGTDARQRYEQVFNGKQFTLTMTAILAELVGGGGSSMH